MGKPEPQPQPQPEPEPEPEPELGPGPGPEPEPEPGAELEPEHGSDAAAAAAAAKAARKAHLAAQLSGIRSGELDPEAHPETLKAAKAAALGVQLEAIRAGDTEALAAVAAGSNSTGSSAGPRPGTQIHVRGVAETFESADALVAVFSRYGPCDANCPPIVRHRIDEQTRKNTSWALVTMETRAAAEAVMAAAPSLPSPLTVTRFSKKQASET
jgi:hypothetical protein